MALGANSNPIGALERPPSGTWVDMKLQHVLLLGPLVIAFGCNGSSSSNVGTRDIEIAGLWQSVDGSIVGCDGKIVDVHLGDVTVDVEMVASALAEVTVQINRRPCLVMARVDGRGHVSFDSSQECDFGWGSRTIGGSIESIDGTNGELAIASSCASGYTYTLSVAIESLN